MPRLSAHAMFIEAIDSITVPTIILIILTMSPFPIIIFGYPCQPLNKIFSFFIDNENNSQNQIKNRITQSFPHYRFFDIFLMA